jgi:uncharacterized protein
MDQEKIITNTISFVKKELKNAEGGHDWFHIERVLKNTLLISYKPKCEQRNYSACCKHNTTYFL